MLAEIILQLLCGHRKRSYVFDGREKSEWVSMLAQQYRRCLSSMVSQSRWITSRFHSMVQHSLYIYFIMIVISSDCEKFYRKTHCRSLLMSLPWKLFSYSLTLRHDHFKLLVALVWIYFVNAIEKKWDL